MPGDGEQTRSRPNILVTGTPGVGKTSTSLLIAVSYLYYPSSFCIAVINYIFTVKMKAHLRFSLIDDNFAISYAICEFCENILLLGKKVAFGELFTQKKLI